MQSIKLVCLADAFNDLQIKATDIQNEYLNECTKENVRILYGPEFGSNQGRLAVVVRAFYDLRSSGACFRQHLVQNLRDVAFKACPADPGVWMRRACKSCAFNYWEYALYYIDDILCISHDPGTVVMGLEQSVVCIYVSPMAESKWSASALL